MYAKVFLVAAALAPVALAQATIDPFNFDCHQGQYGYGWSNGSNKNNNNNDEEDDRSLADIPNIFQNYTTITTRTAPGGNTAEIAQASMRLPVFVGPQSMQFPRG